MAWGWEAHAGPPGLWEHWRQSTPKPACFLLCYERRPVCPPGACYLESSHGLVTAKQEVLWTGLQHPLQLKNSSPKAGNLQVTLSHLVMGTLAFTPP